MTHFLNAFQMVRPKGTTAPSATPQPKNVGRAPGVLRGSRVLDRNGRPCVPLAPRAEGVFLLEDRKAGQASADKRRALVRGGI